MRSSLVLEKVKNNKKKKVQVLFTGGGASVPIETPHGTVIIVINHPKLFPPLKVERHPTASSSLCLYTKAIIDLRWKSSFRADGMLLQQLSPSCRTLDYQDGDESLESFRRSLSELFVYMSGSSSIVGTRLAVHFFHSAKS